MTNSFMSIYTKCSTYVVVLILCALSNVHVSAQVGNCIGCDEVSGGSVSDAGEAEEVSRLCVEDSTIKLCAGECITLGCDELVDESLCINWIAVPTSSELERHDAPEIRVCPTNNTTYQLKVIDENGRVIHNIMYRVLVSENEVDVYPKSPLVCDGVTDIELFLMEDYTTYKWSNGRTTPSVFVQSSGSYSVTVSDENQCEKVGTVEVKDIGQDENNILSFFRENGFLVLPAIDQVNTFTEEDPGLEKQITDCDILVDYSVGSTSVTLKEDFVYLFGEETVIDISDIVNINCDEDITPYKVIVTDNQSLCTEDAFKESLSLYGIRDKQVSWVHIFEGESENYLIIGNNDGIHGRVNAFPEVKEHLNTRQSTNGSRCTDPTTWDGLDFTEFNNLALQFGNITYSSFSLYSQRLGRIFEDAVLRHYDSSKRDHYAYSNGTFYVDNFIGRPAGAAVPDYISDVYIVHPKFDEFTREVGISFIDWYPWTGIQASTGRLKANLAPVFFGDAKIKTEELSFPEVPLSSQARKYIEYMDHDKQIVRSNSVYIYLTGFGKLLSRNPGEHSEAYIEYSTLEDMKISQALVSHAQSHGVRIIHTVAEWRLCQEGPQMRLKFAGEQTSYPLDPLRRRAALNDRSFDLGSPERTITINPVYFDWTLR